jgi:uncharacterized membrane protein YbhN (UPF0104 family)
MKLRKIPRGTFLLGGLGAVALSVPLLSIGIYTLTQELGWGPKVASLDDIFWISLIFSGFPALVVGGGVARLVAHRCAEQDLSLPRALILGALTLGLGGIGLALVTALPLGALPEDPRHWSPLGGVGLLAGALTGLALSILVALRGRRHRARNLRDRVLS